MGNENCCEDPYTKDELVPIEVITQPQVKLPSVTTAVRRHIDEYRPFQDKIPLKVENYRIGEDIFQGQINENQEPDGYGHLYLKNGNVVIGLFKKGKVNGPCQYIMSDGSYYDGNMVNNQIQAIDGEFHSKGFKYRGGFKNNKFHGEGEERGINYHFIGTYVEGRRAQGYLEWETKQESELNLILTKKFSYKGNFDKEGKFTGKGKYCNEFGEYEGNFLQGKKQGKGQFKFSSGLLYEGEYQENQRCGKGTLYGKSGGIAFSGDWKNNLPNGRGFVINEFGDKVNLTWIDGIDEKVLKTTEDTHSN